MLALMDKKKDITCHHCGRTGHMVRDCWVKHPELIAKGVRVSKTLLRKLRTPPTRQDTRGGPNRSPADRGKPPPKKIYPPCPTPGCGKTNHRPEDCFISYPEKAEEYKRRFKK